MIMMTDQPQQTLQVNTSNQIIASYQQQLSPFGTPTKQMIKNQSPMRQSSKNIQIKEKLIMNDLNKNQNKQEIYKDNSFIRFKKLSEQQLYNPRLKITGKSKQLTLAYVYKVSTSQVINNLQQISNSNQKVNINFEANKNKNSQKKKQKQCKEQNQTIKRMKSNEQISFNQSNNSNKEQKNCELITQVKKKGIKDYTVYIRKKKQEKPVNLVTEYAMGSIPMKNQKILNYFQIKIAEHNEQSPISFVFGIVNSEQGLAKNKNLISISFKFTDAGNLQIYRGSYKIEEQIGFKVKVGDVIGCGFEYHRYEVFMTYNGQKIYKGLKLHYPDYQQKQSNRKFQKTLQSLIQQQNPKFYPFIGVYSYDLTLQSIFQHSYSQFSYNYTKQLYKLQNQFIQREIQLNKTRKNVNQQDTNNTSINSNQRSLSYYCYNEENMYAIMLNYFKYYGYEQTATIMEGEMMNKNMKFYPQNQPIRNKLQYSKKYYLINDQKRNNKQKKIKKRNKTNKHPQQNKFMSEQLEQEMIAKERYGLINQTNQNEGENQSSVQIQVSGSDVEMMEDFYKTVNRPNSNTRKKVNKFVFNSESSQQNIESQHQSANYCINKKKMEKKVQQLKRSDQEKFKLQRIQIMKHIQQGKIQMALILFSKSFKEIFYKQKHLQVFFKAHIFLKLYYEQGLQKALQYAKIQHKSFTQFQNYLMPFYNPKSATDPSENQCQYRPVRQILFLICIQNKEKLNFQKQLQIFANFISTTVCEDSGFFGMSKLELVLSHYQSVQNKILQYQLPIGGLDLENINNI